jgi:hypothetical protein
VPRPISFVGPFAALACLAASPARADEFIVTDVTYTHAAANTMDSQYRVSPASGTPKNWTSPINFAAGSVHVLLEVKTKPSAAPTRFQVCFEGTPSYACTGPSPVYTTPGIYQWSTPFANLTYGGNVDWTQGENTVELMRCRGAAFRRRCADDRTGGTE